ncbi:MAG: hypothetical protein K0R71_1475 [Bacillales bacterium]|jgi:hypothetical protein|nr:hypothetical protein [Bacillales bacterium]
MDKIDGSRFNFQKGQNDWFDFKKIQTEEQLKITSTVQPKTETFRADLQKSEQQQQNAFQDTRNPFQDVDDALSGFQKLLEFATMNNSATAQVATDIDLEEIISSMKNQFRAQTFSGKEFDSLLTLLKQNSNNTLIKNAIADVLRAFSALQTANAAQSTIEKATDELLVLLKNDGTFQKELKKQGSLEKNATTSTLNLLTGTPSIRNLQKYETSSRDLKDLLHQIKNTVSEESSIYKTIDRIFSAMKRLDDAQRFDLKVAVEKLLNLPGQPHNESTDKLTMLLQKALGTGSSEERVGGRVVSQNLQLTNLSQELTKIAQFPPEKNELENVISVINQLKKQYPQSYAVQNLTAQTLNGLTANLLTNQPMLHFFLKSFLNESPHVSDVWIDPEYEEGSEKSVKVYLSVDLENDEGFEVELRLNGKMLSAKVLCPESYIEEMQGIKKVIREQANSLGYSVPNLSIGVLSEKHALEDIFGKNSGGRGSFHARV